MTKPSPTPPSRASSEHRCVYVILGSGKRLFGEGTPPGAMRMIEHEITPTGNIIATYRPDGPVETGSFQAEEPGAAELDRREKVEAGVW